MASKMENWSIADYLKHFELEIGRAEEQRFKDKFSELTKEMELLDSEFMTVTKGCAKGVDPMIDQLHSLAGRVNYCERPRGFEADCDKLYRDLDKAIDTIHKFRETCAE